jgi:hypothetical protein
MIHYQEVALRFATALSVGDFATAHALLGQAPRTALSAFDLQKQFKTMIAQGAEEKLEVEVMETLKDWPTKQDRDVGWVYVTISGQTFAEALTMIVCEEARKLRIRELEWGRP